MNIMLHVYLCMPIHAILNPLVLSGCLSSEVQLFLYTQSLQKPYLYGIIISTLSIIIILLLCTCQYYAPTTPCTGIGGGRQGIVGVGLLIFVNL